MIPCLTFMSVHNRGSDFPTLIAFHSCPKHGLSYANFARPSCSLPQSVLPYKQSVSVTSTTALLMVPIHA